MKEKSKSLVFLCVAVLLLDTTVARETFRVGPSATGTRDEQQVTEAADMASLLKQPVFTYDS